MFTKICPVMTIDPRPLSNPHPHLLPLLAGAAPLPDNTSNSAPMQDIYASEFTFAPILDSLADSDVQSVTLMTGRGRGIRDIVSHRSSV